MHHRKLLEILENKGIGRKCLRIIRNLYATQTAHTRQDTSTIISITKGVCQGCILSPTLYNIYSEEAFKNFGKNKGTKIGGQTINRIMYADDTVILSDSKQELEELIKELMEKGREFGLKINFSKTKIMKVSRTGEHETSFIEGKEWKSVTSFEYLGVIFQNDNKETTEFRRRIAMAHNETLLRSDLSLKVKRRMVETMIHPIIRYGSEMWPETKKIQREVDAFEHWALRRISKISWTEKKTNEEVRNRMNMVGLTFRVKIKERRFRHLGHILRGSAGRELRHDRDRNNEESKVRGRKRRKWHEIGKSVTGIKEFKTLKENAEDRGKWRKYLKEANLPS